MRTVRLGDVVHFYSGGTPSKANASFWDGDVPWFSAKDMKKPRLTDSADHISEQVFRSTSLRKIPAGTVAMVVRGMILAHTVPIAVIDVEAAINQDLKALIPRTEIDPTYLSAVLNAQHDSVLAQVSTAAHGTKKLESRILEGLQIPLPPIVEQRRVAAILDHADSLRTKRRQVLAHLDDLTQAIFHDMFGHLAWRSTLGDLADVQIGPFGSLLHQEDYIQDGVAVLNPTHISGGALRPDPAFSVTQKKAESLSLYRVREGDVLMGRRGEMGRAGVAYAHHSGMLCGTGSLVLRPKGTRSVYLHAVVTSPRMKTHLERNALGATLPNLNAGIVKTAPAPGAAVEAQEDFVARVEKTRQLHRVAERAAMSDDGLFSSLQSRGFRGEL